MITERLITGITTFQSDAGIAVNRAVRPAQIIAICGGSGSGKSTLSSKFVNSAILSTDSFYWDLPDLCPRADGSYDFDHPAAVDLQGCADACLRLASGQDVMIPLYNIRTCRREGEQLVPAPQSKIVVIEGIFAFNSPLKDIATLKVFIDTPVSERMARRLRRDHERGRTTLEIIRQSLHVEESYEKYVQPMKQLADLVLMGEEMHASFGR